MPLRGVPHHGLTGGSDGIVAVRRDISRAADLNIPVLIRGATGTGKELVAQALHRASSRRDGPFVAINLGAVTPTLAAAELFGVVKGAFTGAERKRKGCFERARGGTLFLDEIGLQHHGHLMLEFILERVTNIAMGTEIHNVNEFEEILCLD
ncbi:MAG: sigma 54-interacting transcriptional regulator, partial [Acidobacteriota bacterium]